MTKCLVIEHRVKRSRQLNSQGSWPDNYFVSHVCIEVPGKCMKLAQQIIIIYLQNKKTVFNQGNESVVGQQ